MKVLICGSRDFADPFGVSLRIDARVAALPPACSVIHGNARGADRIAAEAAKRHGHAVTPYPARWKEEGKQAGILRNIRMLDAQPDLVLAFWNGKSGGTQHTILEARRRGINVETEVFLGVPGI